MKGPLGRLLHERHHLLVAEMARALLKTCSMQLEVPPVWKIMPMRSWLLTEDLERARRQITRSTPRCSEDTAQSKSCWHILTR